MSINYDKYILSTGTHYISNSGSDENKAYHGGKAGDQTGKEWQLKAYYSRPWSVVLRYPNQSVALTIAQLGIAAALNDKIGYDQYQRDTYWKQLQKAGYDPSKITTPCEDDCTAGVSANVKAAGYIHHIPALEDLPLCSSRNMREKFTAAGFKALTGSKYTDGYNYLLPGDILLYENHHAATNITLGKSVKGEWNPHSTMPDPELTIETTIDDEVPPEEVTFELPCIRANGNVNVRRGPDTSYGSLGVANKGTMLRYYGFDYTNGWHLVEFEGNTGWVSPKYTEVIG